MQIIMNVQQKPFPMKIVKMMFNIKARIKEKKQKIFFNSQKKSTDKFNLTASSNLSGLKTK